MHCATAHENRCHRNWRISAVSGGDGTVGQAAVPSNPPKNDVQTDSYGTRGAGALSCLTRLRRFFGFCVAVASVRRAPDERILSAAQAGEMLLVQDHDLLEMREKFFGQDCR